MRDNDIATHRQIIAGVEMVFGGKRMKITLKDCASKYEGRKVLEPADWPRAAALIRAAQEVIDVAETYYTRYAQDEAEEDMGYTKMHLDAVALRDAIAAFRDLEAGE